MRLVLEGFAAGLFVSLVLALAVFIAATQAQAAPVLGAAFGSGAPAPGASSANVPAFAPGGGSVTTQCARDDAGELRPASSAPMSAVAAAALLLMAWFGGRAPEGAVDRGPSARAIGASGIELDAPSLARRVEIARSVC